jgi:hypothetical protein
VHICAECHLGDIRRDLALDQFCDYRTSLVLHDYRHSFRTSLLQNCEGKLCPARQKGCAGVTITAAKKRTSTRNKTAANLHPFHLSIKQNKSCHEGTTGKTPVVPKAEVK